MASFLRGTGADWIDDGVSFGVSGGGVGFLWWWEGGWWGGWGVGFWFVFN